jgi:hypothetical protein
LVEIGTFISKIFVILFSIKLSFLFIDGGENFTIIIGKYSLFVPQKFGKNNKYSKTCIFRIKCNKTKEVLLL